MATYITLEEALTYGIKYAQKNGADQVEAYSNNSKEVNIGIEKNIPSITTGYDKGISFRVVAGGNIGFAFTKTLTKARIESTIKIAVQNAKAKGKDSDFKSLPTPSKKDVVSFKFEKALEDITADTLADGYANTISKINDVKGLHYLQGQVFLNIQEERILSSTGIDISSKLGGIGGYAASITTKGLIPNYSYGIMGGPKVEDFNFDLLAEKSIEQTQRAAAPRTMNFNKEVPIILEPEASVGLLGGLFNLLITQLQGDNVDQGATPYSDQVGNQIAVENLSLTDNGVNQTKFLRSIYDGEGVPREETVLIDKGILKTFLLDTYFGTKLGLESNGKSSRSGLFGGAPSKSYPSISSTTVEFASGDSSKDEMIAETKEGFMLRSLMGLHMSDRSSGRFSITGFGWYIKNGEIKHPAQGIAISGMLPELIKNIDLISKERESLLLGECPYIRFANVPTTSKKFDFKTRFGLSILKIIGFFKGKHPMI